MLRVCQQLVSVVHYIERSLLLLVTVYFRFRFTAA